MLKGIDPLLNAEILGALRAMGHGDDLILADTNFPSDSVARLTALGRLLRIDAPAARVAKAVLSVYPLDSFVDDAAARMEIVGDPGTLPGSSARCRPRSTPPRAGPGRCSASSATPSTSGRNGPMR